MAIKHLYLHIPFCHRRCSYCDFNTYANMDDRIEAYVDALCAEITARAEGETGYPAVSPQSSALIAQAPSLRSLPPTLTRADLLPTIFFGGGTPTMLTLEQFERVLRAADRIVPLTGAEITVEANPGTVLGGDYLRGLRSLGINRISMGVQSLDDPTLRVLGRIHTADEARRSFEDARAAGFERINLDFIFGLPGQTVPQWRATLDEIMGWGADHFSLYSLILEQGTPLHAQVTSGRVSVPTDDTSAEMYELAMERFAAGGYTQYEISNWAKDDGVLNSEFSVLSYDPLQAANDNAPQHSNHHSNTPSALQTRHSKLSTQNSKLPSQACHHNLAYWLNADYLAAGAGAHGHVYPRRYHDVLRIDEYIAQVAQGRLPTAETIELDERDLFAETMFMGLRLNVGVSFAHFRDRCGAEMTEVYGPTLGELEAEGLLERDDIGVRLTERGRMFGNQVFARFV